jgi:hypothetical protein
MQQVDDSQPEALELCSAVQLRLFEHSLLCVLMPVLVAPLQSLTTELAFSPAKIYDSVTT